MEKEHIGKKGALVISLVILVTIVQLISTTVFSIVIDKFFSKEKSFPCPSYCEEISKQISDLDLKGFKYTEAEDERKKAYISASKAEAIMMNCMTMMIVWMTLSK